MGSVRRQVVPLLHHLGDGVRKVRDWIPRPHPADEKVNFVRFGVRKESLDGTEYHQDSSLGSGLQDAGNGFSTGSGGTGGYSAAPVEYSTTGGAGESYYGEGGEPPPTPIKLGDETIEDEELNGDGQSKDKITEWQAAWNVTNAIQGMFILSFPYAVQHGGYWAVIAIVSMAFICGYTGKVLIDCLYEETQTGELVRVRTSYVEVAEAVWGARFGGRIVNLAQIIELMMTCILYLVLCGDLLLGSFPNTALDMSSWIMVSAICLLPCALLNNLRHVSWISFWNTITHVIINAIILVFCVSHYKTWKPEAVQFKIDIWTFPISLGIIVFSYTSHIFLPTLEGSLTFPGRFRCMLYLTHLAAAIFKALFGYVGFITFGEKTEEVITNNLLNPHLKVIVNMALLVKCLLSYPLPYYATVKLFEVSLFKGSSKATVFPSCFEETGSLKIWALILRLLVIAVTIVLAICIPHFAILMGLIGSFTGTMLSFVWPAYFHLRIKGNSLPWYIKLLDVCIILIGVFCGTVGIYYSAHALHRVMRGEAINPFKGSKMPIFQKPILANSTFSYT